MRRLTLLAAAAALTLASLAISDPALAGRAVTLKADTVSAGGMVTLGDIFDDAGGAADTPVANRQGASVILDAAVVQAAARRAGLDWANAEGLRKIVVHGAGAAPSTPSSTLAGATPAARGNVEVLTWSRSLQAGEIIQPTDLLWAKAAAAPGDAPSDADAVIGQAAKRPLRAGAIVQAHDVAAAVVIKSGDLVTVTYDADGVSLSMQGKAMGSAGVGEMLAVQNPVSKKIVQTVVAGPGQAVVGPGAGQLKSANHSARYAAR